jgi:RNA polymerase sigma-70 factor, ECF subfamily
VTVQQSTTTRQPRTERGARSKWAAIRSRQATAAMTRPIAVTSAPRAVGSAPEPPAADSPPKKREPWLGPAETSRTEPRPVPSPLKLVHPVPARPRALSTADDAALVEGALRGDEAARAAIYDRHAEHVHRVLYRTIGVDRDLADLHHDVFVRALSSLSQLENPSALRPWLTTIAVFVARTSLTRRQRRRWLWFMPAGELPEVDSGAATGEVLDALRATYLVLDGMPADERIAFALRFIDGMELTEVAHACETSLATIKRRLSRACVRFEREARKHGALESWLEGGTRWGNRS